MVDVVGKAAASAILLMGLTGAACSSGDRTGVTGELSSIAARGRGIVERVGCASCHEPADGDAVGPGWAGSWGTEVELDDGTTAVFDAAFVIESVRHPAAQRRRGDWPQMPAFESDQLSDNELDAIVAYLEELGTER